MKSYPFYKDTGIDWIGKIPVEWKLGKIKYTTYVKGRIGWHGLNSNDFIDKGPFLVTGTDFVEGRVNWESCYHVSEEKYNLDPLIILKEGDLLITKDGTIGKLAIVRNLDGKATLNSGIFVTRSLNNIYKTNFMYWILSSEVFEKFINYFKTGSTVSHLYQDMFSNFSFPLPPIIEQVKIASFLSKKNTKIDHLISKKQKIIELLQEQRAALINRAVTKGLDPNAPMKDSGIPWLGKIPEHWEVKKLKYISNVTLGKMLTPGDKGDMVKKPYLRAKNISWLTVDIKDIKSMWFSKQELKQYGLKKDDLLVCEGGEVGRACIWDKDDFECYIQNSINRVRFFPENNSRYFLYLFYFYGRSGHFDAIVSRVSIAHLTKEKLENIHVIIPPKREQKDIVLFLEDKIFKIENTINRIKNEIELLKEYRTALVSEVVTGKIDVRDSLPKENTQP